ncbi:hypothetical protein ACSBR2_027593 [Camellia fascicularis]
MNNTTNKITPIFKSELSDYLDPPDLTGKNKKTKITNSSGPFWWVSLRDPDRALRFRLGGRRQRLWILASTRHRRAVVGGREISTFLHACEGDAVTKLTNEKIPYFNAPIYLQNKTQIGKVEEIFGPINESDMLPILTELHHALDMQVALENHVEEGNFFKVGCLDVVRTDRTLVFYEKQEKLSKLWDILAAYAWFDIDVGYCQVFKQFLCPITDEILEQAYFNALDGDEPLALDMGSMGKGQVWINGQSIGRYWTAFATGNCNGHGEYGTRSLCLIKHKADAW